MKRCSSVLEFSKGVLEQVFEEFEKALITRAFARLRFEVRLTRLLVEVVRDRSRIRTRYRSRVRLQDRSCDIYEFVFDYEIEVVFDYEVE